MLEWLYRTSVPCPLALSIGELCGADQHTSSSAWFFGIAVPAVSQPCNLPIPPQRHVRHHRPEEESLPQSRPIPGLSLRRHRPILELPIFRVLPRRSCNPPFPASPRHGEP